MFTCCYVIFSSSVLSLFTEIELIISIFVWSKVRWAICYNIYQLTVKSCCFLFSWRSFEIIPAWAPWATDDLRTLRWMDSGLQVSFCLLNKNNRKSIEMEKRFNGSWFPSVQDMDKRLQALMATCEKLPTDNLNNFRSAHSHNARLYIWMAIVHPAWSSLI